VGSTNNVERRLDEHNAGMSRSSSPYAPYKLLASISFPHEHQARTLEKYFKTGSGRTILKKRILNDEDLAEHEVRSEA
jgi:putative endonuclease